MHYESSVNIQATPDQIWPILVDAGSWSAWDSGVDDVEGVIAPGKKITIKSQAAPGRAFPVRVTTFDPGAKLEFTGGMPLGLFTGVRTYLLTRQGADGSVFTMREDYTGPLVRMIARSMPDLQPSFDQFTAGLKQRVESR